MLKIKEKIESRCGIRCCTCVFKEKNNCKGCINISKPFWGDSCPVKKCCEDNKIGCCGNCKSFPCAVLKSFAFDKEQGDNGLRIENCKKWCMKYDWKKNEKNIYLPKEEPVLVEVPKAKYFCIKGKGNPNNKDFTNRIGVLYTMSYAVKMMPKNGYTLDNYFEYTVYPLEGLWDLTENGKNNETLLKDELLYTIMIKQPDFVDENLFQKALEISKKKKPSLLLEEVFFDEIEDGLSVQILHIGSYDDEPKSFDKMKEYVKTNSLKIKTFVHREIYLSDSRKVEKNKLRTVLRYRVSENS